MCSFVALLESLHHSSHTRGMANPLLTLRLLKEVLTGEAKHMTGSLGFGGFGVLGQKFRIQGLEGLGFWA